MLTSLAIFSLISIILILSVIRLDRYQINQDYLPVGSIWLLSSIIYGGVGAWGRLMRRTSYLIQFDVTAVNLTSKAYLVYLISIISFSIGYCVIAEIEKYKRKKKGRLTEEPLNKSESSLMSTQKISFYLLILLIANLILIQLLDLGDRYNTYPSSSWPGKLVNSLSIVSSIGPAAFFTLALGNRSFESNAVSKALHKKSITLIRLNYLLASSSILLIIKTGSRSYLLGLAVAFCLGSLVNKRTKQDWLKTLTAILMCLCCFAAFSETLRIARSNSDFYNLNPGSSIKLIGSSMSPKLNINQLVAQANKHPLDEAIYADSTDCKKELLSARKRQNQVVNNGNTMPHYLKQLEACKDYDDQLIGQKHWPSLNSILIELRNGNSAILFPSTDYLDKLIRKIGLTRESVSIGEAPSLRAEVFQRYGYGGVSAAFSLLGAGYGYYNTFIGYLYSKRFSLAKYLSSLLPLTLLTGGLSLTLLSHAWLVIYYFPKILGITWAIGSSIEIIDRKYFKETMEHGDK